MLKFKFGTFLIREHTYWFSQSLAIHSFHFLLITFYVICPFLSLYYSQGRLPGDSSGECGGRGGGGGRGRGLLLQLGHPHPWALGWGHSGQAWGYSSSQPGQNTCILLEVSRSSSRSRRKSRSRSRSGSRIKSISSTKICPGPPTSCPRPLYTSVGAGMFGACHPSLHTLHPSHRAAVPGSNID